MNLCSNNCYVYFACMYVWGWGKGDNGFVWPVALFILQKIKYWYFIIRDASLFYGEPHVFEKHLQDELDITIN